MMPVLATIGTFLLEHSDLIELLIDALRGGASKDEIMRAIRTAMVAASDAEMKREMGV